MHQTLDFTYHVNRDEEKEDKFIWPWTNNGQYSPASTYSLLHEGDIRFLAANAI
jgi:hypothetical protein